MQRLVDFQTIKAMLEMIPDEGIIPFTSGFINTIEDRDTRQLVFNLLRHRGVSFKQVKEYQQNNKPKQSKGLLQ